ncbi:MAG TPA: hypothetical protein VIM61_09565 [Chthoniobacterales bacterium]|jgi:hypothetical protein
MKLLKIAAMGLVALSFVEAASAQTKIYITGSSAFRSSAHVAIMKLLGGSASTLPTGSGYAYTGSSLSGANAASFQGTFNGNPVIIKTSWSGSAAGVQTVASSAGSFTVGFLPDSVTTSTTGTSGQTDPRPTANPREAALPDMAFTDVYQTSTPFRGTLNGESYDTLVDNLVGVIPFRWVKSKGAAAGITNMTPLLAQATWIGTGTCPLALYTGLSADQGTLVYATGRDGDSGTRIAAFAESGIGNVTSVQQWDPATEALYAQQTVNGLIFPVGEGGESSGGTLAGTSKMGKTGLTKSYVSYMGITDAATMVTNGGATLLWNGVDYSPAAVQQGQYTFWSYEHLVYKSSLAGTKLTFGESLTTQLVTVDGSPLLGSMNVVRSTEGGVITAAY